MRLVILQDERVEHAKTKTLLVSEEEKLQFANREIEILKTQLEREKTTFERAYVCACPCYLLSASYVAEVCPS